MTHANGGLRLLRWALPALVLLARSTSAQGRTVVLTISGGPVSFPAPAAADFQAGFIQATTPLSYNVNMAGGNAARLRTTTVAIRSTSAAFGSKALSDLQWRRSDLATWNSFTTTNVTVEARQISLNSGNNWTNSIVIRSLLHWATDAPATATANLVVTLTVTTP